MRRSASTARRPTACCSRLSTYAVAGSPTTTVDPTCDQTAVWTQTGADPAVPCHPLDLSNGNNFNPTALASAITTLRGKALGCVYDLPTPPGKTIDPTKVNVVVTINGVATTIPKRTSMSDPCTASPGCWDYDANMKVDLIGYSCTNVSTSSSAEVNIDVGCVTVTK